MSLLAFGVVPLANLGTYPEFVGSWFAVFIRSLT